MKNKTLRTNSMKLKKVIAASLAISVLFAFTGCGSSSSTNNTNTKQESSSTTETGSADELNEKLNDLYQQENQLFADHKDAWDKAFGLMNKNAAGAFKRYNTQQVRGQFHHITMSPATIIHIILSVIVFVNICQAIKSPFSSTNLPRFTLLSPA